MIHACPSDVNPLGRLAMRAYDVPAGRGRWLLVRRQATPMPGSLQVRIPSWPTTCSPVRLAPVSLCQLEHALAIKRV